MGVCPWAWGKQLALGRVLAEDPALWDRDRDKDIAVARVAQRSTQP